MTAYGSNGLSMDLRPVGAIKPGKKNVLKALENVHHTKNNDKFPSSVCRYGNLSSRKDCSSESDGKSEGLDMPVTRHKSSSPSS